MLLHPDSDMFVHVMNLRNYSLLADSISEWTLKTFYPGWQQEWNLRKLVSNTHGMPRKIRLQKPNSTRKFICNKLCPLQFWWLKFQRHVISLISCQPARWNHSPHLSVDLSPRKFPTCNVPKEGPATTASEKTLAPPWWVGANRFSPNLWQIWKLLDLFTTHSSWWFQPTHLKNMRKSNWVKIFPKFRD